MAIGEHIDLVPRDLAANLAFRERLANKGSASVDDAAALRGMCKSDPLFFINAFCWTLNPMWFPNCPERPFITYPFQDVAVRRMLSSLSRAGKQKHLGKTDLVFLKSRGMGASWLILWVMLWRWMFFRSQLFVLVSQKASKVDKRKDMDALLPKLDFAIEHLPRWLRPRMGISDRTEQQLYNPSMQSTIRGEACTADFARGGRPTAIGLDEFAFFDLADSFKALRSATGASFCCWFVSTTNGVGNAFHKIVKDDRIERLEFKWEDMPCKSVGLYRSVEGVVEYLDQAYIYPADYQFIDDGMLRSVWYDAEEARTGIRSLMAQEHDRDFIGSGDPFFKTEEIGRLMEKTSPPTSSNIYSAKNGVKGELRLWLADRASKCPPVDRCYVVGVDVSAGTGASNSCLCVFDCRLKEKVAELADPNIDPFELAEIAAQVGRWFLDWTDAPALMVWEANGSVGRSFGKRIQQLGYENLYYSSSGLTDDEKKARVPGLWATGDRSQSLIRDYGAALCGGRFHEPSADGLKECYDYRYFAGGKIAHYKEVSADDPSGARDNHGDRVSANAVALRGAASITEEVPTNHSSRTPSYPCFFKQMQDNRIARQTKVRHEEGWLTG